MRSNARGTRRMELWTSRLPSMETITSSHHLTTSVANTLSSSPVDRSVISIGISRSSSHRVHRFWCINASPPESTTRWTCRLRSDPICRSISSRLSSCLLALACQMSHITQRQLQRLCGISTSIGRLWMRWVVRVAWRRSVSSVETLLIGGSPRSLESGLARGARAGRPWFGQALNANLDLVGATAS